MYALAPAKVPWSDGGQIEVSKEGDKIYSRFRLTLEELDAQSWRAPISGIRGLVFPEELEFKLEIPWEERFF